MENSLDSKQSGAYYLAMKTLTVRVPEELHKALKLKCVSEGTDMNSVVVELIESYVKASKPKTKK